MFDNPMDLQVQRHFVSGDSSSLGHGSFCNLLFLPYLGPTLIFALIFTLFTLIFALKHRLWVLIRTASSRRF